MGIFFWWADFQRGHHCGEAAAYAGIEDVSDCGRREGLIEHEEGELSRVRFQYLARVGKEGERLWGPFDLWVRSGGGSEGELKALDENRSRRDGGL